MKKRKLSATVTDKPKQLKSSEIREVRATILKSQGGICLICGNPPKIACLDHEHKKRIGGSGLIRGVLCNTCNAFIAKSENNCVRYGIDRENLPAILRSMADYLEKKHYPLIHPSEATKPPKLMKTSYNKMLKWHKNNGSSARVAPYPRSGKLTKPLEKMFEMAGIQPEFYGNK